MALLGFELVTSWFAVRHNANCMTGSNTFELVTASDSYRNWHMVSWVHIMKTPGSARDKKFQHLYIIGEYIAILTLSK